jgi:cell division transport system permease protein
MGSFLSSVISISLVLLLVGVVSLLMVNAKGVSDFFKENVKISVMMKQNVSLEETQAFKVVLDRERYIKSSEVISAEQGAADMAALLGEDFLSVFETSPIPVSVEVSLRADYVSVDSLLMIQNHLMGMAQVDEVSYQTSLVDALNANMSRISAVLGVFIALLLFISFVLINNTVRLSVYDRRFTVHTMNLVGATRAFIRAPFLLQSLFQGVFAALFAVLMLLGMLFYVKSGMAQLFTVFRLELLLAVIGIVLASGIVICVGSTYFVVGRLISLKKDELY